MSATSKVAFWILLGGELVFVSTQPNHSLISFYQDLREHADTATIFPGRFSYNDCKFYLLKTPPSVMEEDDDSNEPKDEEYFPDTVKKFCLEGTNRKLVKPGITKVSKLASEFSRDHVYLAIDFPDVFAKSNLAIQTLRQEHNELFECLQATVRKYHAWSQDDVERNLKGGVHAADATDLPSEFEQIQEVLAKKRLYRPEEQTRDYQNARSYRTEFDRVFAPAGNEPITVLSDREFATFYNVLRCYHADASKIRHADTSSLKASNFTVHFIQPVFFSEHDDSRDFKFQQEKSLAFPLFLETSDAKDTWKRFTPRSDWNVVSPSHNIPFVISEVISQKDESDRCRMLIQAIALARAGQFLLKSTSERRFFVVAIYVNKQMLVSRYIVMQTGRGGSSGNNLHGDKPVCIHRKDFNLIVEQQELDFLREMYNLKTQIMALSGDLDPAKQGNLKNINVIASKVLSISTQYRQPKTPGARTLDSIDEESEQPDGGAQDEDDLGVFESQDIQNVLRQMNYAIEFIPFGHPRLALIVSKTSGEHGYLKFVERKREVEILQYLSQIDSPSNHTISGVKFWPVQGGTVISMPVAGGWLTSLTDSSRHLWSVAVQFLEAVRFMHDHNVAHMDLKPSNVIIPTAGGRLSIIDFSVSIRVRGPDSKYTVVVGTEGYIAPEVLKGKYKPMLADLWSCGRTLEELCGRCRSSVERTKLLEIARQLMNEDPEGRPTISTVLKWMVPIQESEAASTLGSLPAISPLYA